MKKLTQFARGMTILIGLVAFITGSALADIVISNGTTMAVSSGGTVVVAANVTIESGGTIDNSGTITVRGNIVNDGTADLGNGSVIMDGTAVQQIAGTTASEFGDLEIDNSSNVLLATSILVDGTLTLTDGLLYLGASDLTLGAVSSLSGTFSSTVMIEASNAGRVVKELLTGASQNPSAFLFPVGDNSGTVEYSPISIDFNLVDVAAGGYFAINLDDTKEPDNTSTTNYLDRYWILETSGLTNYNYDFTATYADGDINGSEADMSGALYDGANWLIGNPANAGSNEISGNSFTDDGNITGVEFRILANIGVVLQGAYNSVTDEMTTSLNGVLPLSAASAYSHIGYTGTESVAAIPSADIVDWILVEVRDATSAATATTAGDTVAGFLLRDGSIVGLDGVSPLTFATIIANNAYFVIIQRNHLAVMTANTPTESFGNFSYDFSSAVGNAYGTNAMYQVDTSPVVWGLFSGETNLSGIITNADKVPIDLNMDFNGYHVGDCNFSGIVTNADKVYIDLNMDEAGQVPN